jgi:hypothetical protein
MKLRLIRVMTVPLSGFMSIQVNFNNFFTKIKRKCLVSFGF